MVHLWTTDYDEATKTGTINRTGQSYGSSDLGVVCIVNSQNFQKRQTVSAKQIQLLYFPIEIFVSTKV